MTPPSALAMNLVAAGVFAIVYVAAKLTARTMRALDTCTTRRTTRKH